LLTGSASVTRASKASTLKLSDAIFRGDLLQTAPDGTSGVTFNDTTTFSLQPNSQITIDDFVSQEHGKHNVVAFEIVKGTVSFVASAVAKTGDIKIDTPTAIIGIRGTTGIIEIPAAATASGGPGEASIKLYEFALMGIPAATNSSRRFASVRLFTYRNKHFSSIFTKEGDVAVVEKRLKKAGLNYEITDGIFLQFLR